MPSGVTKNYLFTLMQPQISDIIEQWDSLGQIFEGQFDFSSQNIINNSMALVYEIIVENGGHRIWDGKGNLGSPCGEAISIRDEGWMYYFYDPDMVDHRTAQENAERYF